MQAGQATHFNATLGYALPRGLWIGANACYLKQVTNPSVNGVPLPDSPEQIAAIGPGGVWDLGHFLLYANVYREFAAVNRPEGGKVVLRLQWVPGRKVSHDPPGKPYLP
jgi:hypothetical protein